MRPVLWDITGDYYDRTNCKFVGNALLNEMKAAMVKRTPKQYDVP